MVALQAQSAQQQPFAISVLSHLPGADMPLDVKQSLRGLLDASVTLCGLGRASGKISEVARVSWHVFLLSPSLSDFG
jgi:hypothetical protein